MLTFSYHEVDFELTPVVVNTLILCTERKSLSVGLIASPPNRNSFYMTCSASGGSSGSPIFLLRQNEDPVFIGLGIISFLLLKVRVRIRPSLLARIGAPSPVLLTPIRNEPPLKSRN